MKADESIDSLTSQVDGLAIAGSNNGPQDIQTLAAATRELAQENASLKQRVDRLEEFVSKFIEGSNGNINTAEQTEKAIEDVEQPSDKGEIQSIITQITSLTDQNFTHTDRLLKYFDNTIKKIVARFLPRTQKVDTLWKIIEECCIQAVPFGLLDSDHYFVSIALPSHLDEDPEPKGQLFESCRNIARKEWARFWALSLNKCPGGPTLFIPPEPFSSCERKAPPGNPPRYLFRAYDSKSDGINNPDIVASELYKVHGPGTGKVDILFWNGQQLSKMLHAHLYRPKKPSPSDNVLSCAIENDNLVSWSSSLMFVIQYANCKFCKTGKDVAICAVDTTQFPKGQFVRDKFLLEHYRHSDLNGREKSFTEFRLTNHYYDNGEWLSQGTLNVQGRSCTLSLRGLKNAGLWDLYPEFDINSVARDAPVRWQWYDFVRYKLRPVWKVRCTTTKNEIRVARDIASRCFGPFDETDMAMLILAFRGREIEGKLSALHIITGLVANMLVGTKRAQGGP
ncbi:unnamed protein product [Fusarium equiseti]|uniref:DUF7587 domain-containing protein n=1 Tax=Fusarium equiseti TaxID=61235 RepID=A0A8J2IXL7_FUSEQ|nr:unnamed protein product [Fusarium equiseti]